MKNKKLLLLPLMALLLVGCGKDDPTTTAEDTTPPASDTTGGEDTTTGGENVDGVISVSAALATAADTTVEVKAAVIATHTRGYLLSDNTGMITYYTNTAPIHEVGAYLHVKGALEARYDNVQFGSTATATLITDEEFTYTPVAATAITEAAWDAFNGKIGIYVSMRIRIEVNGSNVNFVFGGATRLGAPQYPDASLGLTTANNGKFFDIKGYLVEKPTSDPQRNNIIVTEATPAAADPTESVTIATPVTDEVQVGKTIALSATVAPMTADQEITWTSSNTGKATVSALGVVTGVAEGEVTIKAAATTTPAKFDEITITVVPAVQGSYTLLTRYSFTSVSGGGSALTGTTLLPLFVAAEGTSQINTITDVTSIYKADTGQGPKISGLKTGTGSLEGTFTLNMKAGHQVARVVITAQTWASNSQDKISINGSADQVGGLNAPEAKTFDITASGTVSFTFNKRVVITEIALYVEA